MRVEVADARFNLRPDYSGEHSGRTAGADGFDCPVAWSNRSLSELGGETVRFRVHLKRAGDVNPRLYAIYLRAQGTGHRAQGTGPFNPQSAIRNPKSLHTPAGTAFALLAATSLPAPTLLVCAGGAEETLTHEIYGRTGRHLQAQGWNVISLDLPCHGADQREGEPEGLAGWRARIEKGENFVADWCRRVDDVLGYLVEQGIADPAGLMADGTSRGGFLACHAAAANPRLRAVAAFAPVTDLLTLREFAGMENDPLTQQLTLVNQADALADRAVWIIIGNDDERVGTDQAMELSRRLVRAAVERGLEPQVTLHVLPVPGHTSKPEWHDLAAAWILEQRQAVNGLR
jgi:pimeloyl-ACP methyl ester carboxylesterase